MQLLSMKKSFLALTLVASASLGAPLTACSDSNQNASTAQNLSATEAGNKQMEHNGSMNHSMEMDLGPADADYDLRFIDAMILHHQGAVVMAKEVQQKSKRPN
jgi:uncharacterized protein (DUF305 family)